MAAFWDARARENAAYFVENRLDYADPDLDAFWAGGETVVAAFEERLGVRIRPEDRLVEIGCGVGRLTRVLASRARCVHALDVSGEMLERARREHPDLHGVVWVQGDGRSLAGIPDAWADGVFSHVVFQHLPDPELTYGYVREMGRVLRPGGWAAFQVSNDPAVHRARGGVAGRLRSLARRAPRGTTHRAWLGSAVEVDALRSAAADADLDVSHLYGEGTQFCLVRLQRPDGSGVLKP